MTENEAIEKHKEDCRRCRDKACVHGWDCLQKKDIEVYEKIQQYRAIGTVKQIMEMQFATEQEHDEVLKYRAIGTVEEIERSMQNVSVLLAENEVLKLYQAIGTIDEFKALKEEVELYRNLDKTNFSDGYNRAIDEFSEVLRTDVESFVAEVNGIRADLLTLDYFSEFVFEVAEQMKEGVE